MRHPPRPLLGVVFGLGLLLQIAALPLRGTGDVLVFKEWATSALTVGLLRSYGPPGPEPPGYVQPDYPPVSVTLLAGVAGMIDGAMGRVHTASRALTFYIKLVTLAAHLTLSGVLMWLVGRWTRDDRQAYLWGLACFLNPALVVNGPFLGYLDSICVLCGVLAMVAASMRHLSVATALAVVAAMIKPQGAFFLLPVGVAVWGTGRGRAMAAIGVVTAAAVVSPFALSSGLENFVQAMRVNLSEDILSGNALNVWWLVTIAARSLQHGWEVFSVRLRLVSVEVIATAAGVDVRLSMACIVTAVAVWLGWLVRGICWLPGLAAYLALVIHVYIVFAISVHENHQVYVVALLLLVAPSVPAYRRLTVAVSLLAAANMVLFYGLGRDFPVVPRSGAFLGVTAGLSMANVVLLGVHGRLFRDLLRRLPLQGAASALTPNAKKAAGCPAAF